MGTPPRLKESAGFSELREGLKQALLDRAFSALVLAEIGLVDPVDQVEAQAVASARDTLLAGEKDRLYFPLRGSGAAFILSTQKGADQVFSEACTRLCEESKSRGFAVSCGGLRHPGPDFSLFPGMADLILETGHSLMMLAKKRGGNRAVWLEESSPSDGELAVISRDFFKHLAQAQSAMVLTLERESRTDFFTGLYNRRGFEEAFSRMVLRSRRNGKPLALMYMDSDSLKTINDAKGHDAGDRFIASLAKVLRDALRGSDLISRWGADEFAVVIEQTTREESLAIAHRLNRTVAQKTEGTMSIGLFYGIPESIEDALKKADEALYRVKRRGKNSVELAHTPGSAGRLGSDTG